LTGFDLGTIYIILKKQEFIIFFHAIQKKEFISDVQQKWTNLIPKQFNQSYSNHLDFFRTIYFTFITIYKKH
jgi:hypothetical protein